MHQPAMRIAMAWITLLVGLFVLVSSILDDSEAAGRSHSQYQTTITPVPPSPNTSVPPEAATEMLISRSRPTSLAHARPPRLGFFARSSRARRRW
jgi:hypothetical protein